MISAIIIIFIVLSFTTNAQIQLRGSDSENLYVDECSVLKGCGLCTKESNCGWCATDDASAGICLTGNMEGPRSGENVDHEENEKFSDQAYDFEKRQMHDYGCKSWKFSQCSASISCNSFKSCGRCVADPFCGWCSSTNSCEEGTSAGPIAGLGSGCVKGTYAHAPMMPDASARTIEALVSSSKESMESHQRALSNICESAHLNASKHLMMVIAEERKVNETLKDLIRTCTPCSGTWPSCNCEGHEESTNNEDKDYAPGAVYVKFEGDEAVKASVTGLGPPKNPHEAAARASRKAAKRLSQQMATAAQDYIRAIEQLGQARLLEDPTMIADAELAVQEADQLLGSAREKAKASAEAAAAYLSENHGQEIQELVDAAKNAAHEAAEKSGSILNGDDSEIVDDGSGDVEGNEEEDVATTTSQPIVSNDDDDSKISKESFDSKKDEAPRDTSKLRFREMGVLEPGPM